MKSPAVAVALLLHRYSWQTLCTIPLKLSATQQLFFHGVCLVVRNLLLGSSRR